MGDDLLYTYRISSVPWQSCHIDLRLKEVYAKLTRLRRSYQQSPCKLLVFRCIRLDGKQNPTYYKIKMRSIILEHARGDAECPRRDLYLKTILIQSHTQWHKTQASSFQLSLKLTFSRANSEWPVPDQTDPFKCVAPLSTYWAICCLTLLIGLYFAVFVDAINGLVRFICVCICANI